MKVVAKTLGIYGNQRRRAGVEFDIKDKSELKDWMIPIDEFEKEAAEPDLSPETMSDVAKGRKPKPQ